MSLGHSLKTLVLFLLCAGAASTVTAQDVFQTGQSVRDYNYLQATYITNRDELDFPLLVNAQISISSKFTLIAEYIDLSATQKAVQNGINFDVVVKSNSKRVGIGYHSVSQRWSNIDWIAEMLFERYSLETTATNANGQGARIKKDIDYGITRLGARASISPFLEVQATGSVDFNDGIFNNEKLNLIAVYRVLSQFDIALGALDATDDPNYNLGIRYSW